MDAVLITKQPYNSANTLAQSVGYAMYNNTLYYKSSSLWKKSSDNTNFNPCTVDSAYDDVDYTNLRCVDNYTYDSGWQYQYNIVGGGKYYCQDWSSRADVIKFDNIQFNPVKISGSGVAYSGYTYYCDYPNVVYSGGDQSSYSTFKIKRTQSRANYKSFTEF